VAVLRTTGVAERGVADFLVRTGAVVATDGTPRVVDALGAVVRVVAAGVRLVPTLLGAVVDVLVRFVLGFFAGVAATRVVLLARLVAPVLRLGVALAALRAALARAAAAPRRGGLAASTAGS
jgi:hypothetical protein